MQPPLTPALKSPMKKMFPVALGLSFALIAPVSAGVDDDLAILRDLTGLSLEAATGFGIRSGSHPAGETLDFYGSTRLSLEGNTLTVAVGRIEAPGIRLLKPTGGNEWQVQEFELKLGGTLALPGLEVATIDGGLVVGYDVTAEQLTIHGGAEARFEGESISLSLGSANEPGAQFAIAPDGGLDLRALSAKVAADLDIFGLQLQLDPDHPPDLVYRPAQNHYAVSGAVTLGIEGQTVSVSLGDAADPGLLIADGVLEHLEFAMIEDLTFAGLELKTGEDGLDGAYDRESGKITVGGSATLEIEGETVSVSLGDTADAGLKLAIDEATGATTLDALTLSVAADLEIAGFTFDVPESDPIEFQYIKAPDGDHFLVSGEVKLSDLWSADLALGTAQHPGLKIIDGQWDLESLAIDLQQIDLGFVTMKEVQVRFVEDLDGPDVTVDLSVVVPEIGEIAADVVVINGALEEIALRYDAVGDSEGLEIAETGISIAELGADLTHLDQPADLGFDGTVGLEFGGQLDLLGETVTLIRVNGDVSVDRNHFAMNDQFLLGAYRPDTPDHAPWKSVLFDGDIEVDLNWTEDRYFLKGEVQIPEDYGLYLDAELFINRRVLDALIQAGVRIPPEIPVIGGLWLSDINVALRMDYADPVKDYAAAWTRFLFWTVGVEYEWNANKFKFLDGAAVDRIESQIKEDENTRTLTKTFSIPEGANAFSVHLDWGRDLPLSEIAMIGPIDLQGTPIEGLLDIELMDLADTGVGVNILPFEVEILNESSVTLFARQGDSIYSPDGSPPPLIFTGNENQRQVTLSFTYLKTGGVVLQASDLKIQAAGHYPNSSIKVAASTAAIAKSPLARRSRDSAPPVRHAGSLLPLDLQYWMLGQHAAEASISLYLDDNAEGHDGRAIVRDLPYGDHDEDLGGGQAFAWTVAGHVPRPHGTYHLYARLDRPGRSPVFSPHFGPFHISPPLHGCVCDPLRDDLPLRGIRVFLDENRDGRFDPLVETSTLTNSQGEFAFHVLPEGTHRIGILPPPGHDFRGDLGGEPAMLKDFEHRVGLPTEVQFHLAMRRHLTGVVFTDLNLNGQRDENEPGLRGVTLFHDADGDGRRSPGETRATSLEDGSYRFHDLEGEREYRMQLIARPEVIGKMPLGRWSLISSAEPYAVHDGHHVPIPPALVAELQDPGYADWVALELPTALGRAPKDDADGDGVSNYVEYQSATNPLDPTDYPSLDITMAAGTTRLGFEAKNGVRYQLEASDDLQNWEPIREVQSAAGKIDVVPEPTRDRPSQFYRLNIGR